MTVKRPPSVTKLIETLMRLFPDRGTTEEVVAKSGVGANVDLDGGAAIVWTTVVNEAINTGKVQELVGAALERHDLPELRAASAEFRKWEQDHAASPEMIKEVASKPPPKLWERARLAILAWSSIALGCFAFIGVIARQSRVTFLGLPPSGLTNTLADPEEPAIEGLLFLSRIGTAAAEYVLANPFGSIAAIAVVVGVILFTVRQHARLHALYIPRVVVSVVGVAAVVKSLAYDVPLWEIRNVLVDYSLDAKQFDVPPLLAGRAEQIWRDVVCSRVANEGGEFVRATCAEDAEEHLQNNLGRFLLDVSFTIGICVAGVATVRKLLLPSRHAKWNMNPGLKWACVAVTGAAMLFAMLPVPATYARTVASTSYPQVCSPDGDCFYRICVDEDRCFYYDPDAQELVPPPPRAAEKAPEDVLRGWLTRQLKSHVDAAPPKATRFGGGPS